MVMLRLLVQGMTFGYKDANWQQEEGVRVINAALDAGVTHLDTSDIYGPFTNEVLVGERMNQSLLHCTMLLVAPIQATDPAQILP